MKLRLVLAGVLICAATAVLTVALHPPVSATPVVGARCAAGPVVADGDGWFGCIDRRWVRGGTEVFAAAAHASVWAAHDAVSGTAAPEFVTELAPGFDPADVATINERLTAAIRLWGYRPDKALTVLGITSTDRDWYEGRIVQLGGFRDLLLPMFDRQVAQAGRNVTAAGVTGGRDGVFMFYVLGSDANRNEAHWRATPAHEWTHVAQNATTDGNTPCWWKEGQAYWYGTVLSNRDRADFATARPVMFRDDSDEFAGYDAEPAGGWEAWLEETVPTVNTSCGPNGAYLLGGLASEYLVALGGQEAQVAFMAATRTYPDWRDALAATYHRPWPELAAGIAEYIRSRPGVR